MGHGNFIGGIFSEDKEKRKRYGIVYLRPSGSLNGGMAIRIIIRHTSRNLFLNLKEGFVHGEFVVATEVTPPLGAGTDKLIRDIEFG